MTQEASGRQLRSTVRKEGILELSLARVPTPEPKPDEVVVRIDATPINPSDLGLMLARAHMAGGKGARQPRGPGRHGADPAGRPPERRWTHRPVAARRKRG